MDSDWIESVVKKHESERQIFKVVKFEVDGGVPKGLNYASVIGRGKFDLVLGSGRRTTKSVIVKQKHTGKKAEALEEVDVFKNEIKVYNDVLREMEYLMDEFNDSRDLMWCQMYGFKPYKTIVFEDLNESGFKLADRKKGLDLNHAKIVLKSLARFHAMSKILIERGIIADSDFPPFYPFCDYDIVITLYSSAMKQLSNVMKNSWPSEWKDIAERVGNQESVVVQKLQKLGKDEKGKDSTFTVLNHGDSWTCNLMFKYNENEEAPFSLRFVDFQVSHMSSYIWDVLYFTYTSVRPAIRRAHIRDILKIYWEALDSNLKKFGYTKKSPSFDDVLKEAEVKEYFAFVMVATMFPGMTGDAEEGFDLEKAADKEHAGGVLNESSLASPKFINDCGDDFKYFAQKGVI